MRLALQICVRRVVHGCQESLSSESIELLTPPCRGVRCSKDYGNIVIDHEKVFTPVNETYPSHGTQMGPSPRSFPEKRPIVIQLRSLLIHHNLRILHRIDAPQARRIRIDRLLVGMAIDEQVADCAGARRTLVDGEARRELLVLADLDGVEEEDGEVLAVVADYVVCGPLLAHVVDYHLAYGGGMWCQRGASSKKGGWMGVLTCLSERLIRKPRLSHFESPPFRPVKMLIDVDNIQLLVHPQLMHIVPHQHSPMLRRIRIFAYLLRDHLAQPGLLCQPFPAHASNWVPANFDGAELGIDAWLAPWDAVGSLAEAEGVFEGEFAFDESFDALHFAFGPSIVPGKDSGLGFALR